MKHGVFGYNCNTGKETQYKNMRGIVNYAYKHCVKSVLIVERQDRGADLVVDFGDMWFTADFADFSICKDWVRGRRSFCGSGAGLVIDLLNGTIEDVL